MLKDKRISKKWIWVIAIVASIVVSHVLFWELYPERVSFYNIEGLGGIRAVRMSPSALQELKGAPNQSELIEENDRGNLYAWHYDGVMVFVRSNSILYFDITGEQYRLGGRNEIGVGSTRREVEADCRRRRILNIPETFNFCRCDCRIYLLGERRRHQNHLPNAGFGYFEGTGPSVDFEFDENDVVVRMRIVW